MTQIMKDASAVFSVSLRDGFANISFDDKGEMRVQLLNDEGYTQEDFEASADDLIKIATFITDIKAVRLSEYKTAV